MNMCARRQSGWGRSEGQLISPTHTYTHTHTHTPYTHTHTHTHTPYTHTHTQAGWEEEG